ncbi:S49 family peptidase [Candidatus Halocynthiibacter alkanivorans]|jgi:signal peptide peptidase SppA|uniref:S49 family peptidase n=1 Tax=Candidatus Halocynthiibacter alkanivorans TaxID=2267619 RepID=UPI000DF40CEB|nr:S49 family peptidase [Candidatus Halocynthiibacter alkanivorans]
MKKYIPFLKSGPLVAVIRMSGVIASGGRGSALNDAGLAPLIERAFRKGKPAAVALLINSPGGSPVQSSMIAARIRRLADEKKLPVYAFVEDVAASGGYWLACAADEIIVDDNSILGSIGVISASFGFDQLMARHGVERRVYTAGKSKSMLDPFRAENPEDVTRIKDLQEQIHANFIDQVKSRRGARLSTDRDMFTGDIWVGQRAIEVGLADATGHLVPWMKDKFGDKVRFALYGQKRGLLQRIGGQAASQLISTVEDRAAFARFGL